MTPQTLFTSWPPYSSGEFCRTSVVTVSTGVEIWTPHFGCPSIILRRSKTRSLNSIGSRDISFAAAFGMVNALELSRLLRT